MTQTIRNKILNIEYAFFIRIIECILLTVEAREIFESRTFVHKKTVAEKNSRNTGR